MYTQCPECGVAFRVTAEVLKMAAGKVRCGGCGVAFNALNHLSEQKPVAPTPAEPEPDPAVPELKPEEPAELEADTPPESISAEQSAALLKTLDQLAGEDIRIEDTGVEWRVIDDDEEDDAEGPADSELIGDTGSMKFIIEGEDEAEREEVTFAQASDEPSRVIDEMLFDDNTVLPDDFDAVVETPSASAKAEPPPSEPEPEPQAPQFDLDLSEPDEWDDLLGDLDESVEDDEETESEPDVVAAEEVDEAPDSEKDTESPPDMDTQFAIQAEAMGIDLSGIHEVDELAEGELDDKSETSIEEDLIAAAFEAEAAVQVLEETGSGEALSLEDDVEDGEEDEEEEDDELEIDLQDEDEVDTEDDVEDIALGFDDKVEQDIATLSMSLDDEADDAEEPDVPEDSIATSEEHVIPEMTEEEKTINMMIDQELFNIAVEDEEGFASTIVQLLPDDKVDEEIESNKDKPGKKDKKKKKKDKEKTPPVAVETIVMEGDFIRGELDRERLAADKKTQSDSVGGPGLSIPINREKDDYARRREMTGGPAGAGTWAGIAALVLLLVVQIIHQSRDALATVPAINNAIAPVYRMLGQPLTPTWNIAGWRFEATKGDTNESGELLTIYSRIGNNSDEALPYPLVHLSLTDRFEEIIGSTVLEPGEYLPENSDPRTLVPPGNTFNAVISINSPSEDATGFKLNVCYRLADGQLRCADHDFK
jgi:predicted Zn finger-like uncharacterized protein